MLIAAFSLMATLVAGQQAQSLGAAEGLRPLPAPQPAQQAPAASAGPAAPGTDATPPATTGAPPRQICRSIPVTGSRFPVRQCRNAVETDAERAEARDMLRRMQGARTMPTS